MRKRKGAVLAPGSDPVSIRFTDARDHYQRIGSRRFYDPNEFFVSSFYH